MKTKHQKTLKLAQGFKESNSSLFRTVNAKVMKALIYSYVGRRQKKKHFKGLWISRINASLGNENSSYSSLKKVLKRSSISLNLKVLAQLAALDNKTFNYLIQQVGYGT